MATPATSMQHEASKVRSLDIAFLVNTEHLRTLESLLKEVGDSLEYQVKLSDGQTIQYHSIDEVMKKQQNSKERSIVSIIGGVTGRDKSAYVVLKDSPSQAGKSSVFPSDTSESPSVEYTVAGTQRNVIFFSDKLDEWTAGIRQWYSIFLHGPGALVFFGSAFAAPMILWKYASPLFSQAFLKSNDWLSGACVFGGWFGEYWLFKLFPRATFAIGQGVKRDQMFTWVRGTLLVGLVISVLGSVIANWFTRHP
jgi:hypothetical protein